MTTTTNAGTGVTRYLRVYTVLSQALAEGNIGAGEALPSEPTLVREYGVSRTTVRRALARLAAEGCIVRRRGSGTFARGKADRQPSPRELAAILDDPQGAVSNTKRRLLSLKSSPTPDFLHRDWPEFGATALTIRTLRQIKGEPAVFETTYVPEEIGRKLPPGRLRTDTVLAVLDKAGVKAVTAEQEVGAVAADPVTAGHLDCGVGAPLLNVRQVVRDPKGRILMYCNCLYRPDCYELDFVVQRTGATQRAPRTTGHKI
jgi:GntR family transcriptional regulator